MTGPALLTRRTSAPSCVPVSFRNASLFISYNSTPPLTCCASVLQKRKLVYILQQHATSHLLCQCPSGTQACLYPTTARHLTCCASVLQKRKLVYILQQHATSHLLCHPDHTPSRKQVLTHLPYVHTCTRSLACSCSPRSRTCPMCTCSLARSCSPRSRTCPMCTCSLARSCSPRSRTCPMCTCLVARRCSPLSRTYPTWAAGCGHCGQRQQPPSSACSTSTSASLS